MTIDFVKIQTNTNDYVLVDFLNQPIPEIKTLENIAVKICSRHQGVGANGMLVLMPGEQKKIQMCLYLPSGKKSTVIHDALLCLGRYCYDNGIFRNNRLQVQTDTEIHSIESIDRRTYRVDMGKPLNVYNKEELKERKDEEFNRTVSLLEKVYSVTPVHLGFNGFVLFTENMTNDDIRRITNGFHQLKEFKDAGHVLFTRVFSRNEIRMNPHFFSETIDLCACAAIASVASIVNGFSEREISVEYKQGVFSVQWLSNNHIQISSRAEYVYSGSYLVN